MRRTMTSERELTIVTDNILWWGERRAGRRRRFGWSGRRGRRIFRRRAGSCVTGSTDARGGGMSRGILGINKGTTCQIRNEPSANSCLQSIITRPSEDDCGKILLCSAYTWRINKDEKSWDETQTTTLRLRDKAVNNICENQSQSLSQRLKEEEKTTSNQHWKGNSTEKRCEYSQHYERFIIIVVQPQC